MIDVQDSLYMAYAVNLEKLEVRDPRAKKFMDLHYGPENAISPLPKKQDYGLLKTIWDVAIDDQYSTRSRLPTVIELQSEGIIDLGFLMFYYGQEPSYRPYPNNPGLKKFEVPYPIDQHKKLIPAGDDFFVHVLALNGRYVPPETTYEEIAIKIEFMARRLRMYDQFNERISESRLWFCEVPAYQVEHALVFIRESFHYLPDLSTSLI
ncbi:MAG: hypothetical protein ABIJ34_09655 [archaeon]